MTIALLLLRYLWPFLLLGGAYLWADHAWCNAECRAATIRGADVAKRLQSQLTADDLKLAELDRERIAEQERTAQLTAAEDARQKEQDAKRKELFAGRADAARNDAALRGIGITDPARRMLGDAYAAGQVPEAASKPATAPAADSKTVADLTAWGIQMLDWANECKDKVDGWQRWYQQLEAQQ